MPITCARAREAIRAHGGAGQSNVFTRFMLALYGVVGWRAVPVMPVEIMLLPRWSPFTLAKISYWSRTSIAPMLVLQALKPKARNARGVGIDELFIEPPRTLGPPRKSPHQKRSWFLLFRAIDEVLRAIEPLFPKRLRRRAIDKAVAFIVARLNGEDGIGAIFPPMAYSLMMFGALGFARDHPHCVISRSAHRQSCWSSKPTKPIASLASRRSGIPAWCATRCSKPAARAASERVARGLQWLAPRQVLDLEGDWAECAAGRAAGRLGLPIRQRLLPRCRRHRRGGDGDGPRRGRRGSDIRTPLRARANGSSACRAGTAAGAPSMPTTTTSISTTSPSPTTARCSIRRPRTSARAASPCWRRSAIALEKSPALARAVDYLRQHPACGRQLVRALGHELHLRHLVGAVRAQCRGRRHTGRGDAQGRRLAHRPSRIRTAAGAKTAQATSSTTKATSRRPAPHRKPPGRCSG